MTPVIIPPNTPVSTVCIPRTVLCPSLAKLPSANVSVIINKPFIEAFIMRNPNMAAKPAVPLSLLAKPIATPTAKMTGKFWKTILPADDININIFCNSSISNKGYALIVFGLLNAPPIPNNKPAAGKIAIGNIKDLPNCCAFSNSLLIID